VTEERRVRVLWLIKGLDAGGAERLLVEHAVAGDRGRFEYEVAYLLPDKVHLVDDLEALGVPTHCLDVRTEADARWLWRLGTLLREKRFDVVHAHSPVSASIARVVIRGGFRSVDFVYTEHNRWQSYHPVTRLLNRTTYALNNATLAVSDDVVESMTPSARRRVEVLTHGIDLDRVRSHQGERDAVREELGIGPDEVFVLTVANLRENKRYPDLLAAARRVIDTGAPVRFAAAGQGPLEVEIRAQHARLGLGDRFRMLGYRSDAQRLIAGADVFALASSHEGLPVAVMEAFALGVPVVATAAGGLAEAIHDGVNGLLAPPLDPDALAAALIRVLDPGLRAHLAVGATAAGARYSAEFSVSRIEGIYREVGTGRRRR
jgi:glycosyltransferase involved in cell wall biosynthesis